MAKSPPNPQYSLRLFEPNNCTDCDEYGGEFAELFTGADMGWKLSQFEQVFGGINPKFRGLAILVKDKEKPSKAALVLAQTFKEAKIEFVANVANGMLRLSDDRAGLVIGPKN